MLLICFRSVNNQSPSPDSGELNISPPGEKRKTKESTNGENLHISFSKITRFRLLMKIRAFQYELEMSALPVLLQDQLKES